MPRFVVSIEMTADGTVYDDLCTTEKEMKDFIHACLTNTLNDFWDGRVNDQKVHLNVMVLSEANSKK